MPPTTAPLSEEDYRALALFRKTLRRFLHFSNSAAAGVGLEAQQYQALLALRGAGGERPMTVGELAEEMQIRPHSAVGLVSRLASRGLVRRQRGEEDRRQVFVTLTTSGEELMTRLAAAHKEELRKAVPALRTLIRQIDVAASPAGGAAPPPS